MEKMSTIWETWEYHTMNGIKSYVIQLLFHFIVYIRKNILSYYVSVSYNITLTCNVWATLSYELRPTECNDAWGGTPYTFLIIPYQL